MNRVVLVMLLAIHSSTCLRLFRSMARSPRVSVLRASSSAPIPNLQSERSSKYFNHKTLEKSLYEWWERSGYFQPMESKGGKPFVVPMPPPNVTGRLHMGHALFLAVQDILVRFNRMMGRPTLWLPGTDHAGIATQMLVERQLSSEGLSRQVMGREAFLERVWKWKEEKNGFIQQQMRRMGASADWSREKFTLDSSMNLAVTEAFVRLHEKGLIYRGQFLVNWSPSLQTAVSDLEVEHREERGKLYYFKYWLDDGSDFLPVSTTRPETILGDCAVCVHPQDSRYNKWVGRKVRVPTTSRTIPVIADEYVDMDFGTGALKVTPAHDVNDFRLGQKHGLEPRNIFHKDGSLTEDCGVYAGMDRFVCRQRLWEDMTAAGLALKVEDHVMNVPRCQRSGAVIEPMVSFQWFLKMDDAAAKACQAVEKGDVRLVPSRFEKVWFHWMHNIHDWCISRQLWWGHRIPAYYVQREGSSGSSATGDVIVARSEAEAREIATRRYGPEVSLVQDEDVLDTWFSSGLWPFASVGWPQQTKDLERFYPATILETGYDILFFWVARMVTMGLELTGVAPFQTIYLHGLVRDHEGQKMSKTKGNVIDPIDSVEQFGCDAVRFCLVTGSTPGQDVSLSQEKLESARNFCNKLWNIGKYAQSLSGDAMTSAGGSGEAAQDASQSGGSSLAAAFPLLGYPERYFLVRLQELVQSTTAKLEALRIGEAGMDLYEFLWDEVADWFVEIVKCRARKDAESKAQAVRVFSHVWEASLRLVHPFMPFVTEVLWQHLGERTQSVMVSDWPIAEPLHDAAAVDLMHKTQKLVRAIRNAKSEYGVEPTKKVDLVVRASEHTIAELRKEQLMLAVLGRCNEKIVFLPADQPPPEEAVHLLIDSDLEAFLPRATFLDVHKETARIENALKRVEKQLAVTAAQLANTDFVHKAPKQMVEAARTRAADLQLELQALHESLARLNNSAK